MAEDFSLKLGLFQPGATEPKAAALLKIRREGGTESGTMTYGTHYYQQFPFRFHPDPQVSPRSLTINPTLVRSGGALPHFIKDSLPDAWGQLILANANGGRYVDDYLALKRTNCNRVGAMWAMTEQQAEDIPEAMSTLQLPELFEAAMQIQYGGTVSREMRRLLELGGTLGGARPKASVLRDGQLWMAKFAMREDRFDHQLVEVATLRLAQQCGIQVQEAETQNIHNRTVLLVRRFDRQYSAAGEQRIHFLSGAGLLNVDFRTGKGSYVELAKQINRFGSRPADDCRELFLRMVFNILIDNTDDHLKNHGFLHTGNNQYQLSPMYDVLPQGTRLGYMGLALKDKNDHPTLEQILACAHEFHIAQEDARTKIQRLLHQVVRGWEGTFRGAGVSDADCQLLHQILAPIHQYWQNALQ